MSPSGCRPADVYNLVRVQYAVNNSIANTFAATNNYYCSHCFKDLQLGVCRLVVFQPSV